MSSIELARDVEVVGGEVVDGVTDGEAAVNLVVGRDLEDSVHHVGRPAMSIWAQVPSPRAVSPRMNVYKNMPTPRLSTW